LNRRLILNMSFTGGELYWTEDMLDWKYAEQEAHWTGGGI
jgi:hypothetical protein